MGIEEQIICSYISKEEWVAKGQLPNDGSADVTYLTWPQLCEAIFELIENDLNPSPTYKKWDFETQYGFINGRTDEFKLSLLGRPEQVYGATTQVNNRIFNKEEEDDEGPFAYVDAVIASRIKNTGESLFAKLRRYSS